MITEARPGNTPAASFEVFGSKRASRRRQIYFDSEEINPAAAIECVTSSAHHPSIGLTDGAAERVRAAGARATATVNRIPRQTYPPPVWAVAGRPPAISPTHNPHTAIRKREWVSVSWSPLLMGRSCSRVRRSFHHKPQCRSLCRRRPQRLRSIATRRQPSCRRGS